VSSPTLGIQRLNPRAVVPTRAHPGDAGLDLCALDDFELGPGERGRIPTGIAIELSAGHAGLVLPRSGLAAKHGIALVNAPGLIDEGYRGELQVLLLNTDRTQPFHGAAGDRIAQLVVVAVPELEIAELDALADTARGAGGFGSTGS
jgi:dUTP pyrophosphatase